MIPFDKLEPDDFDYLNLPEDEQAGSLTMRSLATTLIFIRPPRGSARATTP